MRVALIDPLSYTPPYDHSLAAALARRGHEVHLLTSRFLHGVAPEPDAYRREELFLPVSGRLLARAPRSRLRLLLKGVEYLPSMRRALRRIEALEPDVVHLQWLPLPRVDRRWVRALAAGRPSVLTAHDVIPRRSERRLDVWLDILATVGHVVVHSQRAVEQLVSLGVDRERIARIPHPVFEAANGAAPEPPSGATLLFFGLIRHYKGLDVLIRALPEIVRRVPAARLIVAGDALDPVEPLRRLADQLGVADRIEWRLGFVAQDRIPALMAAATVVVLPYRRVDASGVLADAIGSGRPAVVSDLGAVGEVVRDFRVGEAVPPEDAAALAAACSRLLADDEALAAAFRATEAARAALSWDAAAEAHERLYEQLIGTPARAA